MISVTKLFDALAIKLGKETADDLIEFVQHNNDKDMENLKSIFATKEDLAKGLANVESKIAQSEKGIIEKIDQLQIEMKNEINQSKVEMKNEINQSKVDMINETSKYKNDTIKWVVGIYIGLLVFLIGLIILYLKLVLPH